MFLAPGRRRSSQVVVVGSEAVGAGVGAPVNSDRQLPRLASVAGLVCPPVMHRPCSLLQPQLTSDTDVLLQLFEHTKGWQGSPIGAEVGCDEVATKVVGSEVVGSEVVGNGVAGDNVVGSEVVVVGKLVGSEVAGKH